MNELFRFTTDTETCPYLGDRPSRLEVCFVSELGEAEYSRLLAAGWRRFGRSLFRPRCWECRECVPIRVAVKRFKPSRSQRRVLRRNADMELEIGEPQVDEERLSLHQRFHEERGRTRGWPTSVIDLEEYVGTFIDNACETLEFRYRLEGRLVALGYVGEARDALNSIYAFYEPDLRNRSLGTFDILTEIAETARRGKEYLYLGYYVSDCGSMAYKSDFRPYELLKGNAWEGCGGRREDG